VFQFIGHGVFEGRAPSLFDSFFQSLILAPLFVLMEVMFILGYKPALAKELDINAKKNVGDDDIMVSDRFSHDVLTDCRVAQVQGQEQLMHMSVGLNADKPPQSVMCSYIKTSGLNTTRPLRIV